MINYFGLLKIIFLVCPVDRFEEYHIEKVWKYLHEEFKFNVKKWKERFEEFRLDHHKRNKGYDKDIVSDFNYFGNTVINPVLNEILGRSSYTDTFNRMIKFILTGKKQN